MYPAVVLIVGSGGGRAVCPAEAIIMPRETVWAAGMQMKFSICEISKR